MKPVLQALVLAEHVYEATNGQKIIAGTFNGMHLQRRQKVETENDQGKKARVVQGGGGGAPWAYISLTDVCNDTELQLQFVSLDKNVVIFETTLKITDVARLQTVELAVPLPPLAVTEAGVYAFEIVCDGDIVGSHRLIVTIDN